MERCGTVENCLANDLSTTGPSSRERTRWINGVVENASLQAEMGKCLSFAKFTLSGVPRTYFFADFNEVSREIEEDEYRLYY